MIGRIENFFRKLRRKFSRSEWAARILGLSLFEGTANEPGLVMIQIDGLSLRQFNRAIDKNELPFLKKLLQKEDYRVYPHYSGQPPSTPAVQGTLFYGVDQCVPSFSFLDRLTGRVFRMYDPEAVGIMEERLAVPDECLLEEGSSYGNVYTGGAAESHFCVLSIGWNELWKKFRPRRLSLLVLSHFRLFIETFFLLVLEFVITLWDFFRGILKGRSFKKELKFIVSRLGICIFLRELITMGAKIDIARGLPIIHLNFIGYDEQAHRRGPSSNFAHWALKGIDNCIEKIWHAAGRSARREYDVWIYSDHGQEDTVPYPEKYGISVQQAIKTIFNEFVLSESSKKSVKRQGIQRHRARFLGGKIIQKIMNIAENLSQDKPLEDLIIEAMGPMGHIYTPRELSAVEKEAFAKKLVHDVHIPMVLTVDDNDNVLAWNRRGCFSLPDDGGEVLGNTHPYLQEVSEDLSRLCRHPNSGDFVFSGWFPGEPSLSFPLERGGHCGPGSEENNAFALLPSDISFPSHRKNYITTFDIRKAALNFLKRKSDASPETTRNTTLTAPRKIRVMTYNVHSCIGMDGKISPERIARVISRYEPDIVALQEIDVGRVRTGGVDQARVIARELEMLYHFHPSMRVEEEQYGNAILSRFPITLVKTGRLPGLKGKTSLEPRGVIWAKVEVDGISVQVINTHFGLRRNEGYNQANELAGKKWLKNEKCRGPIILCGDFNALPGSKICGILSGDLVDAQNAVFGHKASGTWFGRFPFHQIDHIFLHPDIDVLNIKIPSTHQAKTASDHLPLIADIKLPGL